MCVSVNVLLFKVQEDVFSHEYCRNIFAHIIQNLCSCCKKIILYYGDT